MGIFFFFAGISSSLISLRFSKFAKIVSYDLNSNFREDWTTGTTRAAAAPQARSTMSVSATVEGFELEDGDVLVAYANGEQVGSEEFFEQSGKAERRVKSEEGLVQRPEGESQFATADGQPIFYLSISCEMIIRILVLFSPQNLAVPPIVRTFAEK